MTAPMSFDAALAALDYEVTHHPDRMVTTYAILGLDAVRAAHRAEVDRLAARVAKLEAEQSEARNRVARLEAALTTAYDLVAEAIGTPQYDFRARAKACVESCRETLLNRAALEDPK